MTLYTRVINMSKWLIVFFDTVVYFASCVHTSNTNTNTNTIIPCSAYFMIDTTHQVALLTPVQITYVSREIALIGAGSMLAFFGGFLGCFGSFGPDEKKLAM